MSGPNAVEGRWYSDPHHTDAFLVIAVHDKEGVIDVRDRRGEIDELDFDEWESMGLEVCSSPPEWEGGPEDDDPW